MEGTEAAATQAILEARELAAARGDYYVSTPGATRLFGPMSEARMRQRVDDLRAEGHKPLVLKTVEDYGR